MRRFGHQGRGAASPRKALREMSDQVGRCEHCLERFGYRLIHNGFNDTAYAYCDKCGRTALFSTLSPKPQGVPDLSYQHIGPDIERYLKPCLCGGRFIYNSAPRCPHCGKELSPAVASNWIEPNASGTALGWRWQQNWLGLYCVVIEQRQVDDPWRDNLLETRPK
jgi:hypothetical protein